MVHDVATTTAVPTGCVDPDGEGLAYWQMAAHPAGVSCERRAMLDLHVLRCGACLQKSLELTRPILEEVLNATAVPRVSVNPV